jgi:hypothetical protein
MGENRDTHGVSAHFESAKGKAPRTSRQLALFGITSGAAWVAEDAFVTRRGDDLVVERWIDHHVATAVIPADSQGTTRVIWETLNNIAVDDLPTEMWHMKRSA